MNVTDIEFEDSYYTLGSSEYVSTSRDIFIRLLAWLRFICYKRYFSQNCSIYHSSKPLLKLTHLHSIKNENLLFLFYIYLYIHFSKGKSQCLFSLISLIFSQTSFVSTFLVCSICQTRILVATRWECLHIYGYPCLLPVFRALLYHMSLITITNYSILVFISFLTRLMTNCNCRVWLYQL